MPKKVANPWTSLLADGLHASVEDLSPAGTLDAKALVRLVDRRWRGLGQEGLQKWEEGKRQSLASIAELAQRWPLQGTPGLGAFKLAPQGPRPAPQADFEHFGSSLREAAASMRRSASDSRLGRTLARSLSGKELAKWTGGEAPAEWDLFKSLDTNLRSLERSFRESTQKQRKLAARRRVKAAAGEEGGASKSLLVAAPFGKASFSDSLPDLQAALKDFQKTVERHIPKTAVVDPGALVTEFIRTRTPLKLPGRDSDSSVARGGEERSSTSESEASTSAPGPLTPAWQILGPMLRLPFEAALAERQAAQAAQVEAPEHGGGGLSQLLRKRRRAAEERRRQRGGSVRDPGRSIAIVTTASLPWMTGTSVNPLLRAAYLARDGTRRVTLLLPWLAPSDQLAVHPGHTFSTPAEQTAYVREWVADRVGFAPDIKFTFYPGRWAPDKCSILPVGDITAYVPDAEADVAVLEEPEHLTWYHHGVRWTDKFAHVVGVVHTNYLEYARREENGGVKEAVLRFVNSWVVRAYCHKVVKLSDAVQQLPRAQTCFVHGVSPRFLSIGEQRAQRFHAQQTRDMQPPGAEQAGEAAVAGEAGEEEGEKDKGVYFIGKVVWGKGYTELLDLVQKHCGSAAGASAPLSVDVFGGGDDLAAVRSSAQQRNLPLHFCGPRDHAHASLHPYRVFVNPSLSDVVATTTAEALAMGKWVVVAQHPSNAFFTGRFRNCLTYSSAAEFSAHLARALNEAPSPLSEEERAALSWEAATERFMDAAEPNSVGRGRRPAAFVEGVADWAAAQLHQTLTGVEPLRGLAGAGPNTLRAPDDLDTWRPCRWTGGPLDRPSLKR